jgi:hypothetical protein
MKNEKPMKLSNRMRLALERQVQEYVDNYHPHMGDVAVEISPAGTTAAVRARSKPKRTT